MRLTDIVAVHMLFTLLCVMCDPVMYPYTAQRFNTEGRYRPLAYRNYPIDSYAAPSMYHRMHSYHTGRPANYHVEAPRDNANSSFTFSDFLNGVNELDSNYEEPRISELREEMDYFPGSRVSGSHKHGQKHVHKVKPEYTEEVDPAPDYTTTSAPPAENKGISVSFLKPDWSSITTPAVNTNMDKLSGLLQLIIAFITGSKSGNLEFKGFKDIIMSGLVKPILTAKGNIKSFISKISIPLLSLLLINVEILVTVWWLWEDCPKEMKLLESTDPKSANNYTYT